jgi:mono/diheme cytochrome c family protein
MCRLIRRSADMRSLLAALLVVILGSALIEAGQTTASRSPSLILESMGGRDSFEFYCAPCHGREGRGDGPVAPALTRRPADLTRLAVRNGGAFPRADVAGFVTGTGRPLAAHGTSEMPVWGPTFRSLDPSDARVKIRIENIVSYIESLQER